MQSLVISQSSPELYVYMVDATDGYTPETGLTIGSFTKRWKEPSGSFAAASGTLTELENGFYKYVPASTEIDTAGMGAMRFTYTGCRDFVDTIFISKDQYDGSGYLKTTPQTGVTVTTNNDKTGYTASTVSDKTGYALTSGERTSIGTAVWATTVRDLTTFGTLVADIWASGTRTLTSFGTLVADVATAVWGAVTRTITGGTITTNNDKTGYGLSTTSEDSVVDKVWDEPLIYHTTGGTEGNAVYEMYDAIINYLRKLITDYGTATAGGASTITLAGGSSAVNDYYNNQTIIIYTGTGAKQVAQIIDYDGSTKVATIERSWATQPDGTSQYVLFGNSGYSAASISSADKDDIVDRTWDELKASHTGAGSTGKSLGDINTEVNKIDTTATTTPSGCGAGSLLDRLCNKDGSQTYNNATDSLEALSDTIPTNVWSYATRTLSSFGTLVADVATAVWGAVTRTITGGTITTNSDKTDYTLTSAEKDEIVDRVWDELKASHTGAGSTGKAMGDINTQATKIDQTATATPATAGAGSLLDRICNKDGSQTYDASTDSLEAQSERGVTINAQTEKTSYIISRRAVAQGGGSNYIDLDLGASAVNNYYNGQSILIYAGTGLAQARKIIAYTGSTQRATVDSAWATNPDSSSEFVIFGNAIEKNEMVDLVYNEPTAGHTVVGSEAEQFLNTYTQSRKIDGLAMASPVTTNSLADYLSNKDGSKTYDKATDSLEAIRDNMSASDEDYRLGMSMSDDGTNYEFFFWFEKNGIRQSYSDGFTQLGSAIVENYDGSDTVSLTAVPVVPDAEGRVRLTKVKTSFNYNVAYQVKVTMTYNSAYKYMARELLFHQDT